MDTVSGILLQDARYCELYQAAIAAGSVAGAAKARADAARLVGDLVEFVRGAKAVRAAMAAAIELDLQLQDAAIEAVESWMDRTKLPPGGSADRPPDGQC